MKKRLKQFICLLALLCIAAGFTPANKVEASTIKGDVRIHTLEKNKWITAPNSKYEEMYKFKVTQTGYYKIQLDKSKITSRAYKAAVFICKTYKFDSHDDYVLYLNDEVNYIALPKGTYYLYSNSYRMRFKVEFTEKSHPDNYCRAKAKTVNAGETYKRLFYYNYEFPQWFKLKLTSSKKISLWADGTDGIVMVDVVLRNSKGEEIALKYNDEKDCYQTTKALSKGTYYCTVSRKITHPGDYSKYSDRHYADRVILFKWKK